VRGQVYRRTATTPLEIPYGAVVIPGSRPMKGAFAEQHHLSVATPVIVKYRDEKTDAGTALEDALR
jgi:2,3,4,5-tetrahydropyridine-2,6-dicarboxylate N-succinyltransferase